MMAMESHQLANLLHMLFLCPGCEALLWWINGFLNIPLHVCMSLKQGYWHTRAFDAVLEELLFFRFCE